MKIDIRSKDSLYITINNHTYYIDDSTNEQIFVKFNDLHESELINDDVKKLLNK